MQGRNKKKKGNALFFIGDFAFGIGTIVAVICALCFIVCVIFQQVKINKYNAEKAELSKEKQVKQERLEELETEDASLSYEEAERKAREELGMVKPGEQILVAE